MHILKPLRFIRSRCPHLFMKDEKVYNPILLEAEQAARRGDGATVQRVARSVYFSAADPLSRP
jgi:hypothetical protein